MKKVLVVDDSPLVGKVVADQLAGLGWEVETCNTAECMLTKSRDNHPDVVLVDIMMPGLGIGSLAEILRAKRKNKGFKVISFSFADVELQEEMVTDGHVDAYFVKGGTLTGLKELIEKVTKAT